MNKQKFFLRNIQRLMMIGVMCLPTVALASIIAFTESDCPLLEKPKTVLLVHATWCSHCRAFMPIYQKVSNEDKYKDWTFYHVVADDLSQICGQWIDAYPVTYKNNMKTVLVGKRSQEKFESFLDSQ